MRENVLIEIDAKWVHRVNSPWYWLVEALSGVSISFAPVFLYWFGRDAERWKVLACFAIIYFVPLFYISLGHELVRAIRR